MTMKAFSFMDFISYIEEYDALKPLIDEVSNRMNIKINMIPSKYPTQSGPTTVQYNKLVDKFVMCLERWNLL